MGHESPREEVTNPMGQHGKPIGMARKGATKIEAHRAGRAGASAKTMSKPTKGQKEAVQAQEPTLFTSWG